MIPRVPRTPHLKKKLSSASNAPLVDVWNNLPFFPSIEVKAIYRTLCLNRSNDSAHIRTRIGTREWKRLVLDVFLPRNFAAGIVVEDNFTSLVMVLKTPECVGRSVEMGSLEDFGSGVQFICQDKSRSNENLHAQVEDGKYYSIEKV